MFSLRRSLLAWLPMLLPLASFAADTRCFEMRTYSAAPGKLEALHARFRNDTIRIFNRHGMASLGYWVPLENTANQLIYVLSYPSRAARDEDWQAFQADPEWVAAKAASEKEGKLVNKVESLFLHATDFSPEIKPSSAAGPRVFELRHYTATPGHLDLLLKRFRDHTTALFTRHGMTNFSYWTMNDGQPEADRTLVYLLAHANREAADTSWAAFRADPEWVAAKAASEKEGGGSLTVEPHGVQSTFLKATDYSPTK